MKKIFLILITAYLTPCMATAQSEYVRDAMEKKFGAPGMEKLTGWMEGHVLNVKMEDTYVFPYSMNMHITTYKKGVKKNETDMLYFFNPDKQYFAVDNRDQKKKQEMFIIYDYKENGVLMLNQKDKSGIALSLNAFMSGDAIDNRNESAESAYDSSVYCQKTGRTKSIQNYPCTEYVCKDTEKNTRTEVWITNRIPVNIMASKAPGTLFHWFGNSRDLEGLMMAGDFYRNDQLESKVEITSVNDKTDLSVHTADYSFSNR